MFWILEAGFEAQFYEHHCDIMDEKHIYPLVIRKGATEQDTMTQSPFVANHVAEKMNEPVVVEKHIEDETNSEMQSTIDEPHGVEKHDEDLLPPSEDGKHSDDGVQEKSIMRYEPQIPTWKLVSLYVR